MLIACWSPKGGSGTTVVAAALACRLAAGSGTAVAVDLAGDLPAALGLGDDPGAPGVADWLAAAPDVAVDALDRLERPVGAGLALLARGRGPLDPSAGDAFAGVLAGDPRPVVVDCGVLRTGEAAVATAVARAAARSLAVLRPCFLGLRRAVAAPLRPSGVVLVVEDGRALGPGDVEAALGVPVVARVRVTEAVARAVDAGLLARRLPRSIERDLRHVA